MSGKAEFSIDGKVTDTTMAIVVKSDDNNVNIKVVGKAEGARIETFAIVGLYELQRTIAIAMNWKQQAEMAQSIEGDQ